MDIILSQIVFVKSFLQNSENVPERLLMIVITHVIHKRCFNTLGFEVKTFLWHSQYSDVTGVLWYLKSLALDCLIR